MRSIAAEHAKEASELESVIRALDKLDFSDASWAPTFERLASLVDQHVAEEEGDFFPKAQKAIGEVKAKALESRYETAKQAALGSID
jgi:Hemerythrin HHE cation binding domain